MKKALYILGIVSVLLVIAWISIPLTSMIPQSLISVREASVFSQEIDDKQQPKQKQEVTETEQEVSEGTEEIAVEEEYYEELVYYEDEYVEPTYTEPTYAYNGVRGDPNGLNSFVGVVSGPNGTTETAYSSNVLYHYRTSEWTPDEYGFYRTADGYYVVASSDYEQGTIIETSRGEAMVLDSGCRNGITDFYTNW